MLKTTKAKAPPKKKQAAPEPMPASVRPWWQSGWAVALWALLAIVGVGLAALAWQALCLLIALAHA